jgi:acetyltransferase
MATTRNREHNGERPSERIAPDQTQATSTDLTPHFLFYRGEAIPSWFLSKDGYWLYARLIQPEDQTRLVHLFDLLSSQARRRRFHADVDHLPPDVIDYHAHNFANVDNQLTGGAAVAIDYRGQGQKIVAVLRLGAPEAGVAEVAVVVRDDFQGRGVGRALLQRLPTLARHMGVHTVVANIEADNLPAIRLFRRLNWPTVSRTSRAETELRIELPR